MPLSAGSFHTVLRSALSQPGLSHSRPVLLLPPAAGHCWSFGCGRGASQCHCHCHCPGCCCCFWQLPRSGAGACTWAATSNSSQQLGTSLGTGTGKSWLQGLSSVFFGGAGFFAHRPLPQCTWQMQSFQVSQCLLNHLTRNVLLYVLQRLLPLPPPRTTQLHQQRRWHKQRLVHVCGKVAATACSSVIKHFPGLP
jgi:hypothetical protein